MKNDIAEDGYEWADTQRILIQLDKAQEEMKALARLLTRHYPSKANEVFGAVEIMREWRKYLTGAD